MIGSVRVSLYSKDEEPFTCFIPPHKRMQEMRIMRLYRQRIRETAKEL